MMRRITGIKPSDVFRDNNIGDVLEVGGKRYCLISRDPWCVYCVRYYWFDVWLGKLFDLYHKEDSED